MALTLLAFALRLHDLAAVTLRWDEGWSIALGRLPLADMVRLTALDVHPPLYYLLLKAWLSAGSSPEFWVRVPSALAATTAVPLAAVAAAAWWRVSARPAWRAGLLAAGYVALAPALVYYAGVTRMYALTAPLLLASTWALARLAVEGGGATRLAEQPVPPGPRTGHRQAALTALLAVLAGAAALYTFYYSAFALAGLYLAAFLAWPRQWRRWLATGLATALLFLPWATYAAPGLLARAGERGAGGLDPGQISALLDDGLNGALFVMARGPWPALLTLVVVLAGALLARPRLLARWGVVLLPVLASLVGAAAGAGAHMFAPRYVIGAAPFLALGLGQGLAGLAGRQLFLGAAAAVLVAASLALPYGSRYVFQRAAEVTEAFDPAADWRALAPETAAGDVVAFNILSLAGLYDRYRGAADPPWTYAQLWDPVHEPLAGALDRLEAAAANHDRLWLVLYKGSYSPGSAAAKDWADTHLFPLDGFWREDTLYQGYLSAAPDQVIDLDLDFGQGIHLSRAAYTRRASVPGALAVSLTWRAAQAPQAKARVFVHAYAPDGSLVAQHDGFPVADTRPQTTWQSGEQVVDRHGLWLPGGTEGPLTLRVGLYDPDSGERWLLAGGADSATLGQVEVVGERRGDPQGTSGVTGRRPASGSSTPAP